MPTALSCFKVDDLSSIHPIYDVDRGSRFFVALDDENIAVCKAEGSRFTLPLFEELHPPPDLEWIAMQLLEKAGFENGLQRGTLDQARSWHKDRTFIIRDTDPQGNVSFLAVDKPANIGVYAQRKTFDSRLFYGLVVFPHAGELRQSVIYYDGQQFTQKPEGAKRWRVTGKTEAEGLYDEAGTCLLTLHPEWTREGERTKVWIWTLPEAHLKEPVEGVTYCAHPDKETARQVGLAVLRQGQLSFEHQNSLHVIHDDKGLISG